MPGSNEDVLHAWFGGLRERELREDLVHPEFVTTNWEETPSPGPYRGLEGLHQWWDDFTDAFEDVHLELRELVPVDEDTFVATVQVVGRFRLTGIPVDAPFGALITLRDGKILSAHGHASPGRAKKAAGLERPSDR